MPPLLLLSLDLKLCVAASRLWLATLIDPILLSGGSATALAVTVPIEALLAVTSVTPLEEEEQEPALCVDAELLPPSSTRLKYEPARK